ncbi:hypothetical protein KR054_003247 [Drosophila jambulina]|nr:hypothetical protein KR054_003247 [Drosophila jambulina]
MGPYPLSDSTNLLGPGSSSYGPGGGGVLGSVAGSAQCYTNYGTNLQTPQPARKCHYDEVDDYNFRRHSAHGRIVRSTSRAEEHHQQQQQQHLLQQQQQQQVHHQSRIQYPTHEYVHCSYEKEVVCDQANPSPAQPSQQPPQMTPQPSHHCQQQRKHSHSHSPHHSRHTSPHGTTSTTTNAHHQPHQHSHHSRHRRRRQGSGSLPGAHGHGASHSAVRPSSMCTSRRHRSVTELSSHACQDPACTDREVQEILVRRTCCNTATNSSSRTELAQCFAEDLYGSSSRRPSSCCTSSDYCYQTDSTSLYGSRSSLSRNNSIKSASALVRKHHRSQRSLMPEHRQPSYTSISLRGLNASRPNSQLGSLTSIFDRAKSMAPEQGSTLERQSSKGALSSTELPEYACSPSPIRWSFLADGRSPTELEGTLGSAGGGGGGVAEEDKLDAWQVPEPEPEKKPCRKITSTSTSEACWKSSTSVYDEGPSTSAAAAARKRRGSKSSRGSRGSKGSGSYHCEFEEEATTTVMFHQDAGEAYNNCCSNNYNYIQCNSYLDQDLQITSEDIHQYLSKGDATASDILNNSKNYPFQPSNALEFQYKNNFQQGQQNVANNNTNTTNTASSDAAECFQSYHRANSKETNLNQSSTEQLSPTNINLSTSSNNINIVFSSSLERNANEVKFINNRSGAGGGGAVSSEVGCEGHHAGYLPYTYPSYDYTNMSGNSHFDKPLGIDELPKEFAGMDLGAGGGASTTSEHSSSLPSPQPLTHHQQLHHFESFDAASEHNLLAQPLSPGSPLSGSINPAGDDFVQMHHYHHAATSPHSQSQSQSQSHPHHSHAHGHHAHHAHSHHQHNHQHSGYHHHDLALTEEQFRLGSALKRVRKRARKYTDFLRKK